MKKFTQITESDDNPHVIDWSDSGYYDELQKFLDWCMENGQSERKFSQSDLKLFGNYLVHIKNNPTGLFEK